MLLWGRRKWRTSEGCMHWLNIDRKPSAATQTTCRIRGMGTEEPNVEVLIRGTILVQQFRSAFGKILKEIVI